MDRDQILRQHLVALLDGRQAHLNYDDILQDVPFAMQGKTAPGSPHTLWQLLEHLRIAQWDILEFSRDAQHVSPEFPKGYWPETSEPPASKSWLESVSSFTSDLEGMKQLVLAPSTDLYVPIPHGNGQTILREALLVADHNAYHLGQMLLLRRQLGCPVLQSLG